MTRVVESVAPAFAGRVRWEKVVIKTREGAERFRELAKSLGRLPPVPSLFVSGRLAFASTPAREELKEYLVRTVDENFAEK
jgi:hypothetical protein